MRKSYILFFFCLASCLFADQFTQIQIEQQLQEAEAQLRFAEQGWMTGNWNGWRYKMADKGVTFIGSYQTDLIGNPVGGAARGFAHVGVIQVLEANGTLKTVYVMKQKLQDIWQRSASTQEHLLQALQEWCREAEATGIEALRLFSQKIRTYTLVPAPT